MVKAFSVNFKTVVYNSNYQIGGSSGITSYTPNTYPDNRPIMVIAMDIADVGKKYPTAISIVEFDVKDVVILDKIICPVKV